MKKITLFSIAVLFTATLFAQSNNEILLTQNKKDIENITLLNTKANNKQRIENNLQLISKLKSDKLMSKAGFTKKLDSVYVENYLDTFENHDKYYKYDIDEDGVLHSTIMATFNQLNKEWDKIKNKFTYDSNGNLIIDEKFEWDNSTWELTEKTEYSYDNNSNITISSLNSWDNVNLIWITVQKVDFEYDNNNKLIEELHTILDIFTQEWKKQSKIEYLYSGNNLVKISMDGISINGNDTTWKTYEKDTLIYASNILTEKIKSIYNSFQENWEMEWRQTFTMNNDNTDYFIYEMWDGSNWVVRQKNMFYYDINIAYNDVAFYNYYSNEVIFNNTPDSVLTYLDMNGNFEIVYRTKFFYQNINTSGISKTNFISTNVYPNPAKDFVNFDLSQIPSATEILIFDMNGKQVLNHSILNGNKIDVSQLNKGFYLYKIIGNEDISAGKLIVE